MSQFISNTWSQFVSFWFPSNEFELENLGLFRIAFYFLMALIVYYYPFNVVEITDDIFYHPVFFYKPFSSFHNYYLLLDISRILFFVLCFFGILGIFTPVVSKLCGFFAFFYYAHMHNNGYYHHYSCILLVNLIVMAMASSGHAFSLDSLIAKKYPQYWFGKKETYEGKYSWPLQFFKFFWCYIFFSSVVLKLIFSQLTWLKYNILGELFTQPYSAAYYKGYQNRIGSLSLMLYELISTNYWVGRVGTIMAILLELLMPLILFSSRALRILVPIGVIMFLFVWFLMGHAFFQSTSTLVLAIVFLEFNVGKFYVQFKAKKLLGS